MVMLLADLLFVLTSNWTGVLIEVASESIYSILQITLTMLNHIFLFYSTVLHIFLSKKKVALTFTKSLLDKDYLGRM